MNWSSMEAVVSERRGVVREGGRGMMSEGRGEVYFWKKTDERRAGENPARNCMRLNAEMPMATESSATPV